MAYQVPRAFGSLGGQIQGVEFVGAFRDELKFGSSKTSRERGAE